MDATISALLGIIYDTVWKLIVNSLKGIGLAMKKVRLSDIYITT
jgi:hypothetical protein